MFSLREFLMTGFRDAVGKVADYRVILNANGYFEKGVLTESDLAELAALIEIKNNPPKALDLESDEPDEQAETAEQENTK